jgi:cellulose synthase/poly-beta-1,6-N-acetylglucosamine synthase-like glycosyltransferase
MWPIYATSSLAAPLLVISPRAYKIAIITGRNALFTVLNFLWWRPIPPVVFFSLGSAYHDIVNSWFDELVSLSYWQIAFLWLFAFKFTKVVVHTISYATYRPKLPLGANATYKPHDVTVLLPSVGDFSDEFEKAARSILACNPAELIVITVESKRLLCERACRKITASPIIRIVICKQANKRMQCVEALKYTKTKIIAMADDHAYWGPEFLEYALTPFEDSHVGLVGTVKRVDRERGHQLYSIKDMINYIAVIYLERHNFECTATCNLDEGVFVISGRCCLMRADISQAPAFTHAFLNEMWFYGTTGPLAVDDDNFVVRWCLSHGWKTIFYNHPKALLHTPLGIDGIKKFRSQLIRWARTTWRSNATELFVHRDVWHLQPWSVYATYFATFVNIAIAYDSLLYLTLTRSGWGEAYFWHFTSLLFISKLIKPFPHLRRETRDLAYIPVAILFGYMHGFLRIYALLTLHNANWGGRDLSGSDVPPVDDGKVVDPKAAVMHDGDVDARSSERVGLSAGVCEDLEG